MSRTHPAFDQALTAVRCGRYAHASQILTGILRADPAHPPALHLLGWIAGLLGDLPLACSLITQALQRQPDNPDAQRHQAAFLLAQDKYRDALQHAVAAARAHPPQPVALELVAQCLTKFGEQEKAHFFQEESRSAEPAEGIALIEQADSAQAQSSLPQLLAIHEKNPHSFHITANLARFQMLAGKSETAAANFRHALWLFPTAPEVLFHLGSLAADEKRSQEAASFLRTTLLLKPDHNRARIRLGVVQMDLHDSLGAEKTLRTALVNEPQNPVILRYLASALSNLGRNAEALESLRHSLAIAPGDKSTVSHYLSLLNYVPLSSRSQVYAEIRRYNALFAPSPPPAKRARIPGEKIRIGYVSGDFRNHSAAFFIEPQLEHANRNKFHLTCYPTRPERDPFTNRMLSLADRHVPAHGLNDEQFARRIREDGIDILVDCSTHTGGNRLGTFALRPAPVQITMIGQMQTTGLDAIDYRISDHFLSPPDAGAYSSEKIIRLESGPMTFRHPLPESPLIPSPSQRGEAFTFGSANELYKTSDAALDVWAHILHSVPGSRFLYFGQSGNCLAAKMSERGIDPARLSERPRSTLAGYFQHLSEIDLALDTFPYNGLTVTLLTCWMGVPCVTLEGEASPARAAAAVLRRIGTPEFVAGTPEEYGAKAVALARHPERLFELRHSLRELVRNSWCAHEKFMHEFESFLESIA
jgi:predicted O-linked N-acetylglucosamine transferase (SPINDLY family)